MLGLAAAEHAHSAELFSLIVSNRVAWLCLMCKNEAYVLYELR